MIPGLRPGNLVDRVAVIAALRKALEQIGLRPNSRGADISLIIPDGACRVLLLDFESLPGKAAEAVPLIRFRLKKLVPFDSDSAALSYQIMSQSRQMVRVLAVTIPRDVLDEYETAVREAGYEPGAVLPSTLSALAATDASTISLVVNISPLSITTAIAREGILMLHRTVDLQAEPSGLSVVEQMEAEAAAAAADTHDLAMLPLVSVEETEAEWAAQEPLPEHGRNPYAQPAEPAPVSNSPYVQPEVLSEWSSELHNAILNAPTSIAVREGVELAPTAAELTHHIHAGEPLPSAEYALEVAQAVNVAAAYFEDTLAEAPSTVLCAGSLSANQLQRVLEAEGVAETNGLRVRDLIDAEHVAVESTSSRMSRSLLAAVAGAVRA